MLRGVGFLCGASAKRPNGLYWITGSEAGWFFETINRPTSGILAKGHAQQISLTNIHSKMKSSEIAMWQQQQCHHVRVASLPETEDVYWLFTRNDLPSFITAKTMDRRNAHNSSYIILCVRDCCSTMGQIAVLFRHFSPSPSPPPLPLQQASIHPLS